MQPGHRAWVPEKSEALVHRGVTADHVGEIASLAARALRSDHPEEPAGETRRLHSGFTSLHCVI